MFRSLRRKIAKIALAVLVMQLSLLGVTAVPGNVSAMAPLGGVVHVDSSNATGIEDGTVENPFNTIQEAINVAVDGNEVHVANGLYNETLDIAKSISLKGESRDGVIIDASGISDYGIDLGKHVTPNVAIDGVVLENFTLYGPTAALSYTYGIKGADLTDLIISNVKVQGSYRSGLDLNFVRGALISNLTVQNTVRGAGIQLTDCSDIVLEDIYTSNNAWGGVAVYTNPANKYFVGAGSSDNVVFTGTNTFEENASDVYVQPNTTTVTNLDVLQGGLKYVVKSTLYPTMDWYFVSQTEATAFALSFSGTATVSEVLDTFKPVIMVDSTIKVEKGNEFKPLDHVLAFDNIDGDITDKVVVSGDTVNTTVAGVSFNVTYEVSDLAGNETSKNVIVKIVDTTAPVVKAVFKPTIVNDLKKGIEVTFTANEKFVINNFTYSLNNVPFVADLGVTELPQIDNSELNLKHVLFIPGNYLISEEVVKNLKINFVAKDEFNNSTTGAFAEVKVDTVVPLAVTDLKATVAENGTVTLNWTNPVANDDIEYIEIRRDGVFVSTLPANSNSFVDSSTEKGKTYYYEVVLVDKAGNKTVTPRLDVLVPAPVLAAAVSDTVGLSNTNTNNNTAEEKAEVKADVDENKTTEENKEEEKKGFPVWGIVLLLVLLAVGGYLYWSQKPATIASVAPKATPVKKAKPKAKKK